MKRHVNIIWLLLSQGFIAWAACSNYLTEGGRVSSGSSQSVVEYASNISSKVEICRGKLTEDIKNQISANLRDLNLISYSKLEDIEEKSAFSDLQLNGCCNENGVLSGKWVLIYREDGRFFVVQENPQKHVTDFLLNNLSLKKGDIAIAKPHITANEGQGVGCKAILESKNYIFEKLNSNVGVIKDNGIYFDDNKPYYMVRNQDKNSVEFSDIKVEQIKYVNNPQPLVKRVFFLGIASEQLEVFKDEFGIRPVNKISTHISIGSQPRELKHSLQGDDIKCLYKDLNHKDSELLKRMLPKALEKTAVIQS
jgi:hypothetical protein